jgi:hypothetical protein
MGFLEVLLTTMEGLISITTPRSISEIILDSKRNINQRVNVF